MTDAELIQQHRHGSHDAFAELVRRHVDWVYSAAKRRVADAHLAEDVTQAVFIALARKAPRLWAGAPLSPWLFGVLRLVCKQAMRAESTRRRHETEAAKMRSLIDASGSDHPETIAADFDELVARLNRSDQQAVLLRFYERKSFAEVGTALGITEEAARERISRATEKLRDILVSKGVGVPAAALAGTLLAGVTHPAPAALAGTIASASVSGGAVASTSAALAKGALAIMTWSKIKLAAGIALAAVLLVGGGTGLLLQGGPSRNGNSAQAQDFVPPPPAIPLPAQEQVYYIGGNIKRSGVYSTTGRDVTVRNSILAAGGLEEGQEEDYSVSLTRRSASGFTTMLDCIPLPALMAADLYPNGPNLAVEAEDEIAVVPSKRLSEDRRGWGPARQVMLAIAGGEQRCFDFETNALIDIPGGFDPDADRDAFGDWSQREGVDVLIGQDAILLLRMACARSDSAWDAIAPLDVRRQFQTRATPPTFVRSFFAAEQPQVITFRTRKGLPGKLRVLGKSEDGRGIRIEFCLVDAAQSTPGPATTIPAPAP